MIELTDTINILEKFGLIGIWSWIITTNEHRWSPGLYRILGIDHSSNRVDYDLMLSFVHPGDRDSITSAACLLQAGHLAQQTFRVIRPDGTLRTVMSRGEVSLAPDGRPIQAMGVLIDVSDREMLARAQAAERWRKRAVFKQIGAFTSVTPVYPYTDFSPEWLELVGLPKQALLEEPTLPVIKGERTLWRDLGRELYLTKQVVHTQPRLTLASGEIVPYRMVMVPMRSPTSSIEGWMNYVAPLHFAATASGKMRDNLEQLVRGYHLRAARGLLGWSMYQLAAAGKLSLSTVRRLEDDSGQVSGTMRSRALAALRAHGIVFSLMNDGTVALSKH